MHVTKPEVQQWIQQNKLDIDNIDVELEASAASFVLSSLGLTFDTSTWADEDTTPELVRKAISMLVAAWTLKRTYDENTNEESRWADQLEEMARGLIVNIQTGLIDLLDVIGVPVLTEGPDFYPNDATGSDTIYNSQGIAVGWAGSEDVKFRMGEVF